MVLNKVDRTRDAMDNTDSGERMKQNPQERLLYLFGAPNHSPHKNYLLGIQHFVTLEIFLLWARDLIDLILELWDRKRLERKMKSLKSAEASFC